MLITMVDNFIIFGAKAPSYLGYPTGGLHELRSDTYMLHWLLDASRYTVDAVTLVGGYQIEAIRAHDSDSDSRRNRNKLPTRVKEDTCPEKHH